MSDAAVVRHAAARSLAIVTFVCDTLAWLHSEDAKTVAFIEVARAQFESCARRLFGSGDLRIFRGQATSRSFSRDHLYSLGRARSLLEKNFKLIPSTGRMVLPDVQLEAMSALDALERVSSVAQPWMPAYVPENQQIEITREPENTMSSATLAAALRAWAGYLDHTGTDAARSQLKTLAEKLIYMLSPADKARMEAAMELMQRGMRPTRAA